MEEKIKDKQDLFRELCETDDNFDAERLMKEKNLAKKLSKAIQ